MVKDQVKGLAGLRSSLRVRAWTCLENWSGHNRGANACRDRQPLQSAIRPEQCGAGESSQRVSELALGHAGGGVGGVG
jgi:hypothetical protein